MMRWTSTPTRREVSLVIFSLTVFALAYNIDTSIRLVGLTRQNTGLLSRLGFAGKAAIGPDGRTETQTRDALENFIYGDWAWEAGEIAGDGLERSQAKGVGRHGAMWVGKRETGPVTSKSFGEMTVDQAFWRWEDDIPQAKVVAHVPGYTVIDNVILLAGTMNIVTDEPQSLPPLKHIVHNADLNQWSVISSQEARELLGTFGGRIGGVSWMAADSSPHNSTLLALWRTYSALDPNMDSEGATTLAPPRRLIYPYYGFFTDTNPEHDDVTTRRQRVVNGIHPELVKAAFPFLTVQYYADWEDYHKMEVPFVFERLVVADRTAAGFGVQHEEPVYTQPFKMDGLSQYWWEPVRRTLAMYFDAYGPQAPKNVVTYVHRQSQTHGLRLSDGDHTALVAALQKMERDYGYEVHIVSNIDEETSWSERLGAIVRSTVLLGVYDSDLIDCAYMQRSPHSTVMEFFPPQRFARDQQLVAESLGMRYIAWWKDRQLAGEDLPPTYAPSDYEAVPIDVGAIIKAVRHTLQQ
ncbi:hypothetical protein FB45DRAFT_910124 [Roridomyces roridus]|uniref:Uncharacterized protein n=1 Tax=Roridomyces roridus TaxID=1738132 RepID=A0AAD7C158_9AGAR|nr:hypothetical protein FB45DRAFT_910124 [Roridomyces roridus]